MISLRLTSGRLFQPSYHKQQTEKQQILDPQKPSRSLGSPIQACNHHFNDPSTDRPARRHPLPGLRRPRKRPRSLGSCAVLPQASPSRQQRWMAHFCPNQIPVPCCPGADHGKPHMASAGRIDDLAKPVLGQAGSSVSSPASSTRKYRASRAAANRRHCLVHDRCRRPV